MIVRRYLPRETSQLFAVNTLNGLETEYLVAGRE